MLKEARGDTGRHVLSVCGVQAEGQSDSGKGAASGGGAGARPGLGPAHDPECCAAAGCGSCQSVSAAAHCPIHRAEPYRFLACCPRRVEQLLAASALLSATEALVSAMEQPYRTAAAAAADAVAAAGSAMDAEAEAADGPQADDPAPPPPSLYDFMQPWGWCGLRVATALRRFAMSYVVRVTEASAAAEAAEGGGAAAGGGGAGGASVLSLLREHVLIDQGAAEFWRRTGRPDGGAAGGWVGGLADAAAALAVPGAMEACCTAAVRNEVELLQSHIWHTLSKGLEYVTGGGGGGGGAGGAAGAAAAVGGVGVALHRLLMSDWVASHLTHTQLRAAELLPLAAQLYVAAGGYFWKRAHQRTPRAHTSKDVWISS